MGLPSTIHQDDKLRVVSWEFLLGVRWFDIPTLEGIKTYRPLQERHCRLLDGSPALIVSYSKATSDALQFDSGLREAVERTLVDGQSLLMGMAQIIGGKGFGAASVRSVLSGIQLTVRPDYPIQLFGDTAHAGAWLEELLIGAKRPDIARDLQAQFLPMLEQDEEPS